MSVLNYIRTALTTEALRVVPLAIAVQGTRLRTAQVTQAAATRTLSMNCGCLNDLTHKESLKIHADNSSSSGTALFAIPDPEKGIMEQKTLFIEDITYNSAMKRGTGCQGVKWIAQEVLSAKDIRQEPIRTRDWCPLACTCGSGNYIS